MTPIIESLENRRLLAGHGFGAGPTALGPVVGRLLAKADGVTVPAVVADVTAVKADQSAVTAASTDVKSQTSDTRQVLQDAITSAFATLKADRQAIRGAQSDPAAVAAATDKLKADRQTAQATIQAARQALQGDATDARTALKDASTKLFADAKQLRTDLQTAGVLPTIPTRPTPPPTDTTGGGAVGTLTTPPTTKPSFPLTPDQAQTVVSAINASAANISGINQEAVSKLTTDLTAAAADSSVTPDERKQLLEDLKTVIHGLNASDVRTIVGDLRGVIGPTAASTPFTGFRR